MDRALRNHREKFQRELYDQNGKENNTRTREPIKSLYRT